MTEEQAIHLASDGYKRGQGILRITSFLCDRCNEVGFVIQPPRKFAAYCGNKCANIVTATLAGFNSHKWVKRGTESHMWRGGRGATDKGYMAAYAPGHPAAKSSGRVLEHRLVMEKHIGRYLASYESVHHKNGVRSDNRIENLELWTKPQVPGQRVEDLVSWVFDNYNKEIRSKIEIQDIVSGVISHVSIGKGDGKNL